VFRRSCAGERRSEVRDVKSALAECIGEMRAYLKVLVGLLKAGAEWNFRFPYGCMSSLQDVMRANTKSIRKVSYAFFQRLHFNHQGIKKPH
jgi:hypothetical protein